MSDSVHSEQQAEGDGGAPVKEQAETAPQADADANAAQQPQADDLQSQVASAHAEIEKLRDEALRARAEMENVRRRAERDVQKAHKFALERLMADLLEVVDSLERGLLAADAEQVSVEQLKEGTQLTHKLLESVLNKHGLTEVSPDGEAFNPEYHEALSMLPTDEAEPNTVVQVIQKGYLLNDRLIRPARVIVAQQP